MKTRMLIALLSLGLFAAWPTTATPPHTAIMIDSGSPYFVPKSATVSSGAPIRWDNPTATDHTITHCRLSARGKHLRLRFRNRPAKRQLYTFGVGSRPIPLSLPHPSHHVRRRDRHRFVHPLPALEPVFSSSLFDLSRLHQTDQRDRASNTIDPSTASAPIQALRESWPAV